MRDLDKTFVDDLVAALPAFAEHGRVADAWIEEIKAHGLALFGQALPADDPGGKRTAQERVRLILFAKHLCDTVSKGLEDYRQTVEELSDGT